MAARSSAAVNLRAGLKLKQLRDFVAGEDVAYQVYQHKMLRDSLLIAPSKEQPLGITASFARHMLGVHTTFMEKITPFWVLLLWCLTLTLSCCNSM